MRTALTLILTVALVAVLAVTVMKTLASTAAESPVAPPTATAVPETTAAAPVPLPKAPAPPTTTPAFPPPASPTSDDRLADAIPHARASAPVTATALSGAVILSQGEGKMTYRRKCERCGALQSGQVTGAVPSRGSTLTSSFTCQKCRESQKLSIAAQ